MKVIEIDRFEGNIAVCELESGEMINIPKNKFPYTVCEGDIINVEVFYQSGKINNIIVYDKNEQEKQRRLEKLKELRNRINRN